MKQKIFVIGFNKCGTTSMDALFKKCKINASHKGFKTDALQLASKYDAITDGVHLNFQRYYDKYPNALFILNTRPLKNWLISRYKHHINRIQNFKTYKSWCWPPSIERTNNWIKTREQHYKNVKQFFRDKPKQFLIVNIENPGWEIKVAKFIKKKKYINDLKDNTIHENKKPASNINKVIYTIINNIVNKSLKQLNMNPNKI